MFPTNFLWAFSRRLLARKARFLVCPVALAFFLSIFSTMSVWSACLPAESEQALLEPYLGYPPTGYKGSPERDAIWHQLVQEVRQQGRPVQFELVERPGTRYDSIEPIQLGAGVLGFVVSASGCQQLIDKQGEAYAVPSFDAIWREDAASPYLSADQTLLRLSMGSHYALVLFQQGRLQARSPREYFNVPLKQMPFWPGHLKKVFDEETQGYGIVDLRYLKEVLAPQWQSITSVGLAGDEHPARYLLARDKDGGTLLPLDGASALLSDIASLETLEGLFPFWPGSRVIERAALVVRINGERGCRLLDMQLRPLMPHFLPMRDGRCDSGDRLVERRYLFTDADKLYVHAYAIETGAHLRLISSTKGQIEKALEDTGLMVVKAQSSNGAEYRIYFANGSPASRDVYDGFRESGCRFMEVRLKGQWLSLMTDGRIVDERYYPLGC